MDNQTDFDRQLRDATLRSRRHWFEDGLVESLLGGLCLVLALYFGGSEAVRAWAGPSHALGVALNVGLIAGVVVACLGFRSLIRIAKERYVYPRAGFVRYPEKRRSTRWLTGLLAGVVGGLSAALLRTAPGLDAWGPALAGFLVGALLFWQARSAGVPRFSLLALLAAAIGLVVSLAHLPTGSADASLFGSVGLVLLASGQIAFLRFLKATPRPEEP